MSSQETDAFFEDFIKWRFQDTPEFATATGIHDHDDQLEHYSAESFKSKEIACTAFLKTADELEKKASGESLVNIQLFKYEMTTILEGLKYFAYAAPISYFEGPQSEILQLVGYMSKETEDDFEKIIKRYTQFSQQADEMIEMMNIGIQQKTTNHKSSMAGVVAQLKDLQVAVKISPFFEPFLNIPNSISADKAQEIADRATEAISEHLLPAFQRLEQFIENSYMPTTRHSIGANTLPDGNGFYKACLKFHLSSDMSPDQVHQLGLQEVERISKEMDNIIKGLNLNLTIQEFSEQIRKDPQFFYTDKEELLQGYRDIVFKEITPKLKSIFKDIPKAELKIQALPSSKSDGPLAFYLAGSFDGKRPGVFYSNVANLANAPKYEMMSLALHEALPGHHLQASYMIELPKVPKFRQIIEDRKYFADPARFPMHTAYLEGWGLYSEFLGHELGLYKDPYTLFGRLSQEIFRACRLVVDTGIHAFGWSAEKAVEYMVQHSAASRNNIEKEVNRYIMWPGQACAYKFGEIKIKTLRQKTQDSLGEKFDLKEFHELVLKSVGPISYLEQEVDKYIVEKLIN